MKLSGTKLQLWKQEAQNLALSETGLLREAYQAMSLVGNTVLDEKEIVSRAKIFFNSDSTKQFHEVTDSLISKGKQIEKSSHATLDI